MGRGTSLWIPLFVFCSLYLLLFGILGFYLLRPRANKRSHGLSFSFCRSSCFVPLFFLFLSFNRLISLSAHTHTQRGALASPSLPPFFLSYPFFCFQFSIQLCLRFVFVTFLLSGACFYFACINDCLLASELWQQQPFERWNVRSARKDFDNSINVEEVLQ